MVGLLGMRYEMRQCSVAGTPWLSHLGWVDIPQLFQLEQIMSGSAAYRSLHIAPSNKRAGKGDYERSNKRLTAPVARIPTTRVSQVEKGSFLLIYGPLFWTGGRPYCLQTAAKDEILKVKCVGFIYCEKWNMICIVRFIILYNHH